jgi:serine/threonine-protein kinase
MAEALPQQFGNYTLHKLIARGGMAEIYRATMPGIGGFEKTVAIKKILPHLAENEEFITMLKD